MLDLPAFTPPASPETLLATLTALDIAFVHHHHAPVMTVDESRALRGSIDGLHAKNLFLKDKKGGLWLVVAEDTQPIDLKSLRKQLGVANLSFAKPDALMANLGVTPGSVTPFAALNDRDGSVRVVLDQALAHADVANFHPLENNQTVTVSGAGLLAFLQAVQHPPLLVDFTALADASSP